MDEEKTVKGLRIFNLLGIPVYINYSWIIIFALVAWSLARFYYPGSFRGGTPTQFWVMGMVSSLLLFACVLLHEFSHSLTARKLGVPVTHITLFIFGGVSNMPKDPDSPKDDLYISAAGPLCSVALCVLSLGASRLASTDTPLYYMLVYMGYVNGALAVFNALPGMPLDGGRILRDIVWMKTGNLPKAALIASQAGKGVGLAIILFGILSFFQGNVIGGMWFVFIGIFMRSAAEQGYRHTSFERELGGITVARIMTANPVTVTPDLPIPRLVEDYFYHYHHVAYPVMNNDTLVGMVDLKRIKLLSREEREKLLVRDVMLDLSPDIGVSPREEVSKVLNRLLESVHGRLLVVENGELRGIIARRDIMDLLRIKTELEK